MVLRHQPGDEDAATGDSDFFSAFDNLSSSEVRV
jgi:hypothetical protein